MFEYDKELEKRTGIFHFKKMLSSQLCDEMVYEHQSSTNTAEGRIGLGNLNKDVKNTIDLKFDESHDPLTNEVYDVLRLGMDSISNKYTQLDQYPLYFLGLMIQLNKKGEGKFAPHMDNQPQNMETERFLAVVAYLNNVKEGGETKFYNPDIAFKPVKGDVIFFPATWKFMHEGCVPKSNDKYVMTTFVVCNRNYCL